MTKKELIAQVASRTGQHQSVVEQVLDATTEAITQYLVAGEGAEVKLDPLGRFHTKTRSARSGINPATGEQAHYPAKNVVQFKPAKPLRDAVQSGG